ncbi:MAG: zinc metalloprotease HtpX, partial [Patescibacteria group bacterium]
MINIYEAQKSNKRKSAFIIVIFVIFITLAVYVISQAFSVYLGYEPGGFGAAGIALIISGLMSLGSYYFSDKIVLKISGARSAERKHDFKFFTAAENLSIAVDL